MSSFDRVRIRSTAESICQSFGHDSQIVDVEETGQGNAFSVIFDLPKPKNLTDAAWWELVNRLRSRLETIDGVTQVHLILAAKSSHEKP